jgi:hypothetical protein
MKLLLVALTAVSSCATVDPAPVTLPETLQDGDEDIQITIRGSSSPSTNVQVRDSAEGAILIVKTPSGEPISHCTLTPDAWHALDDVVNDAFSSGTWERNRELSLLTVRVRRGDSVAERSGSIGFATRDPSQKVIDHVAAVALHIERGCAR